MKLVGKVMLWLGVASILSADPRGVLQFEDGNRITGELVQKNAQEWVFKSDRFGEIRAPRQQATFLPDETVSPMIQPAIPQQATPVARTQTPEKPDEATISKAPWWRPHSFRGNVYGILSDDDGDRKEEGGLEVRGVWMPLGDDELRLDGRWLDKVKNNDQDELRTTLDAYWRVDVSEHWFTYLGGNLEWDDFKVLGLEPRYFMQRYQGGVGYNLVKSAKMKSRVAATWNFFRFQSDDVGVRFNSDTPSMLIENELSLPWGMKLHQIGQIYFWQDSVEEWGVDNEIELTKALGSHWHVGTRHEWRKNATDLTEFPFSKWRLFMGLSY